MLLKALKEEIGKSRRDLKFNAYSDKRAIFRYDMHTLPTEIEGSSIGTSTLFAAWNAAIYVAQIEDARLEGVVADGSYLDATRATAHRVRRALVLRRILRGLPPPGLKERAAPPPAHVPPVAESSAGGS